MIGPSRLAHLLLYLYPRRFRERFREEWLEAASWHWRASEGARHRGLRFTVVILRDTARALPAAWGSALGEGVRARLPVRLDVVHAVRGLTRSPGYTAATVGSIAIGVGANVAIFSVVNAVLLEPLPYDEPDRLVIVWNEFASGQSRLPLSGAHIEELRAEPGLFTDVGGVWATTADLAGEDGEARALSAGTITPNFFDVLGVPVAVGRTFGRDVGAGDVPTGVLISHELWREAFGAAPRSVGSTILLDGEPTEVIGVLPEGFTLFFPPDGSIPARLDVYRPLPWSLEGQPADLRYLRVVGRLRPDVGLEEARRRVAAAAGRARDTYPELSATGDDLSAQPLHEDVVRSSRPALLAMMGAAVFFMLLASTNVAGLATARTSGRRRELAVRSCIGGTRTQLVRLLLAESVLVGVVGAGIGLGLGVLGAELVWGLRPAGVGRVTSIPFDGAVAIFTGGVTLGSVVLFGLAPLLATSPESPVADLRQVGPVRGRSRAQEWIVVAEVAIGLILVVGAGLLTQTLGRLASAEVGFEAEAGLTFTVAVPEAVFPDDASRLGAAREIERRVAELPGVTGVGATSHVPFGTWANWAGSAPPDGADEAEEERYFYDHRSVTDGYFDALRVTLVEGRTFDSRDGPGSEPVIMLDRTAAAAMFPGGSAVGRVVYATRYVDGDFVATPAVVVGVVRDVRDVSPARPSTGQVFWPFGQSARWELTWVVRSSERAEGLLAEIRREVRLVDARLSVGRVSSLDELFRDAIAQARFVATLGGILSAIALSLAALGLYSVVTFVAVRRYPEMGLRVVLGATAQDLGARVLKKGLQLGAAGAAAGVVGALLLTGFLESLLYEVDARDPWMLLLVATLFLGIALVASLRPALRAARLDPLTMIRE